MPSRRLTPPRMQREIKMVQKHERSNFNDFNRFKHVNPLEIVDHSVFQDSSTCFNLFQYVSNCFPICFPTCVQYVSNICSLCFQYVPTMFPIFFKHISSNFQNWSSIFRLCLYMFAKFSNMFFSDCANIFQ